MKNGCRKKITKGMIKACNAINLLIIGCWTTVNYKDVDYSYYLGDEYKKKEKGVKMTSTIICNHVSWLDGMVLLKSLFPAFAPKEELSHVPFMSNLLNAVDSIYMPRGGTEESK